MVNLPEVIKRNFPWIKVDLTGNEPLCQSPLTNIGKTMGFTLAIGAADTKVSGFIFLQGFNAMVKYTV